MIVLNSLPEQRVHSIDVFRGITILAMIFVNEVAGIRNIPNWMKHMPAEADGMTFVDLVFPAFLFIVGMSIPLAFNNRIKKGDNFWQLQWHILIRTSGLLVLGFFMVNAESGYNEEAMNFPISLWSLCFYAAVILIWNIYKFKNRIWSYLLRGTGIALLIFLAFLYRGGDGSEYMRPQWWGILGLIGWAYLYSSFIYQVMRGNKYLLLLAIASCIFVYIVGHSQLSQNYSSLYWTGTQAGNAAHTSIVLCGILSTLIFFDRKKEVPLVSRFAIGASFATILTAAGYLLRPYYKISKIYATPTWCLYSAAICIAIFGCLYWITDVKGKNRWTSFFQPAASNPLLTYIIPFILWAVFNYFGFYLLPKAYQTGIVGILFCLLYAISIMIIVKGLNKIGVRLQF